MMQPLDRHSRQLLKEDKQIPESSADFAQNDCRLNSAAKISAATVAAANVAATTAANVAATTAAD